MGHLAHPARARPEKKSPAGGDRVAGPALRVAARARCARRATNGWTGRRAWGYDRGDLRMKIRLVSPAERFRAGFLGALGEFQREGLAWWIGGDLELAERDFAAFVAKKLADAEPRAEGVVAKTHLWAIAGARFVGRISIHHALSDALRISGGHIGYDTVPSLRGRGVASEMLRQALPVARGLGLREVLLTCDDTNVGSIRVIERNGGVLRETRALAADRPHKRYYWIGLGGES